MPSPTPRPDHDSDHQPQPHEQGPDHGRQPSDKPGQQRGGESIERDIPDENGEPPSVEKPGNPEESEPPVENF